MLFIIFLNVHFQGLAITSSSGSSGSGKNSFDQEKKAGPIKSQSVPPLALNTTSIEYETLGKATSAPMSASSSRSESPMSDRYCGRCSSLISLHLRTIESDGELTKTAKATQTRPQSKGKLKSNKWNSNSRAGSCKKRCSLEKMEAAASSSSVVTVAAASTQASMAEASSPSRRLKRMPLRSTSFLPLSRTGPQFDSSSSDESLHSST